MEYLIWIMIALLLIWVAIVGRLGSVLGAIIDPGSMIDHSGKSEGGEF